MLSYVKGEAGRPAPELGENIKTTLLTVCKLLEKYHVRYLIVGGLAVALNGYYRHSVDIFSLVLLRNKRTMVFVSLAVSC